MPFTISATTLTFPDGTTMVTAAQSIPSGTKTNFFQAAAPTGWTQCTTYNDYAIRIVNGTGGGTGGSVNFSTAFASQAVGGTVSCTTLSTSQIPSHTHTINFVTSSTGGANPVTDKNGCTLLRTSNATGGGGSHNHSFSGTAINLAVRYVNNIIAVKS